MMGGTLAKFPLLTEGNRTNRWTGATGSDFRIKRGPANLLGSAVARSTQTLGGFAILFDKIKPRSAVQVMRDLSDGKRLRG
jgi:hypothetical protein